MTIEELQVSERTDPRTAQMAENVAVGCRWRQAHDALAAHGRARVAGRPDEVLRPLWDAYCLALTNAVSEEEHCG